MNKPRKNSGKKRPAKKPRTHDSFIISKSQIIKRSSVISSAITDQNQKDKPVLELADEEEYLKKTLQRERDEGKYIIKKKLMSGGMGAVYYIFDNDFKRHAAMKVVLPELKHDSSAIESFIREARITGQLEHPNVIPVHDLGFFPGHGIFFTMKLIRGEPLNAILQKIELGDEEYLEKYDLYSLLNIFRKVCDGVAFAHSQNIIHRDIKPHNIMVGDYGEVLLMDWGLAKQLGPKDMESEEEKSPDDDWMTTEIGVIKGSPAYMSPEQSLGKPKELDAQSDVFLLGATLYNMLTFYPPYIGDDIQEIVQKARRHKLIPPDELDTGRWAIPEDLRRIIMKALAKAKKNRYKSVEDLVTDVDAFIRGDINFCHRFFDTGDVLIREGEVGAESYILVNGKVQVSKLRSGRPVNICTLGGGDSVGEMSMITSEARSATVTALEPTEVMVLNQELFRQHMTRLPPWLGRTIVLLAERLYASNNDLRDSIPVP